MNRFEHNQPQEPSDLARKHRRRARAAAWTAGITGLLGVPTAEAASSQPVVAAHAGVAAGHEISGRAEQSPQAFVAMVDKKMTVMAGKIKSAKHVQILKGPDVSPTTPADVRLYYVSEPSPNNPHHYNLLGISTRGNQKTPILMVVALNADSNKLGQVKNSPDGYYLDHPMDVNENFMPGTIELAMSKGPNDYKYEASTTNYDSNHPPFGERTDLLFNPVSPSVVSSAFNTFFRDANEILSHNK